VRPLLLVLVACGALASRMHPLATGALMVYADDGRVLVATSACRDESCMTLLPGWRPGSVRVERFGSAYLIRAFGQTPGTMSSSYGIVVQLADPPRLGCEVGLDSYGCSAESGGCTSTSVELLPDGDAFVTRVRRSQTGLDPGPAPAPVCTRHVLGPRGCENQPIACPTR